MGFRAIAVALCWGAACLAQGPAGAPHPAAGGAPTTAPAPGNPFGIQVGPATTVFTGPRRADGTIDYVAALNARDGRGVTPENNAAALLVRIVHPRADPKSPRRRQGLRLMGIEPDAAEDLVWRLGPSLPADDDHPEQTAVYRAYLQAQTQPWSAADNPRLARWLDRNAPALDLAVEASRRPRFWMPLVRWSERDTLLGAEWAERGVWNEVMAALRVRAMLKVRQADPAGAWQDLSAVHRLAMLAARSPGLTGYASAVHWLGATLAADRGLLQAGNLSADQLRGMLADLRACGRMPDLLGLMDRFDRFFYLEAVQSCAGSAEKELRGAFPGGKADPARRALAGAGLQDYDWNRMLRFGNAFFDAHFKAPAPPGDRAARRAALREHLARLKRLANPDGKAEDPIDRFPVERLLPLQGETAEAFNDRLAATILLLILPSFERSEEAGLRANARLDWTEVAVALEIARRQTGQYPERLDALTPKPLPRLPDNPPGQPMRYDRRGNGYVLTNRRPAPAPPTTRGHLDPDEITIEMTR